MAYQYLFRISTLRKVLAMLYLSFTNCFKFALDLFYTACSHLGDLKAF